MTDFLAGFYSGVALGWIVSQLFSGRRRVPLIRSPRRYSNLLELPPLPRLDPGRTQRGNGHGGPTTPKPKIAPKPQYPGGYISLDGAQPFQVRGRPQPVPDELDAYTYQRGPQDGTPNPPPEVP